MRYLLTALPLLPVLVSAQELHTFKNGEVADADKLNESLQYILNNASGGCSVEQVNNTAEITCADGTTAVVPGYGTVVVLPEGTAGEVPTIDFATGPIVMNDANDVLLGEVHGTTNDGWYLLTASYQPPLTFAVNNVDGQVVIADPAADTIYYLTEDCTGTIFSDGFDTQGSIHKVDDLFYFPDTSTFQNPILFKSKRTSEGYKTAQTDCVVGEFVDGGSLLVEYTPAPEILNAAYPVRVEQLP